MRVAVLGSGNVGRALGAGLVATGHDVMMASRTPDSETVVAWLAEAGDAASAGSYPEAAAWCELAVFVPSWSAASNAALLTGPEHLADKVVIDVTNPLGTMDNGEFGLVVGRDDSAGEMVQRWFPSSNVVKAFNTVGASLMFRPDLPGGPPTMPICGNDDEAKARVGQLLAAFGWDSIDLGDITAARYLEPMCGAWMAFGQTGHGWTHAWKMLRVD